MSEPLFDRTHDKKHGRWRFSLRTFLLIIPLLGAGLGLLGIFVLWNLDEAKLSRLIDPILTRHEVTLAVQQDEIVWLSLSNIPPSDVGILELHQFGITQFQSSIGTPATRPVNDADVKRLLGRMPHLRALDLRRTNTSADLLHEIRELEELEWLWLDATHCTDANVESLFEMTSLRRLSIEGSNLSATSLEKLHSALEDCEIHVEESP